MWRRGLWRASGVAREPSDVDVYTACQLCCGAHCATFNLELLGSSWLAARCYSCFNAFACLSNVTAPTLRVLAAHLESLERRSVVGARVSQHAMD